MTQYLGNVSQSYRTENSNELCKLLRLVGGNVSLVSRQIQASRMSVVQLCESSRLPAPMDEMMTAHLNAMVSCNQKKYAEAYDNLVTSVMAFLRVFKTAETLWVVAPLCTLVRDLRRMAELADRPSSNAGAAGGGGGGGGAGVSGAGKVKDSGSQLMRVFRESLSGAGHKGKKVITLFVVNQLLKTYFKLNTLHLCKTLIKAIDSPQTIDFELFSAAQKVTYKFFIGRLAVFNDDYFSADVHLSYAFKHCHRSAIRNKRTILTYLVPVRLLLGSCPDTKLLQKHRLEHYEPIVTALKTGNVKLLNDTLRNHQQDLIRTGTYILLEKLKSAVYRTLLRKIHIIHKTSGTAKLNQLPLAKFQTGLAWMGVAMDMDEVECVVVNLIYRKYVNGYISHKNQVLVLSKKDPFPKLKTVLLADPS